jgi:hypothetical protein
MRFSRRASWPILFVVAVILVASVGAIEAWRTADSYAAEADLSSEDVPATASCLASLLTGDPRAETGDMVFLNDVKLKPGPKPQLFIAIGAKGDRLLVRWEGKRQTDQPTPVIVDITGIIRQMPTPRILHTEWLLSKKEIEVVGRQSVYIAAQSVTKPD